MKWGYRTKNRNNNNYGYETIDFKDINIFKPVVLVFGGNATIGEDETDFKESNGMAKLVQGLLGLKEENMTDIFSIRYEKKYSSGVITDDEIKEMAEVLEKLLYDKNGKLLNTEQAQKNMRNINIFSYCYGGEVTNKLSIKIYNDMIDKGFSEKDSTKILSQIFHLSYAPKMNSFDEKYNLMTNVLIKNIQDSTNPIRKHEYFDLEHKIAKPEFLDDEHYNLTDKGYLAKSKIDDNNLIIYTNHLGIEFNLNPHDVGNFKKTENFILDYPLNRHNYRINAISTALSDALSMSIVNSIKNSESKELEELNDLSLYQDVMMSTIKRAQQTIEENKFQTYYNKKVENHSIGHIPVQNFLKELGTSEKELINGEYDLSNLPDNIDVFEDLDCTNTRLCQNYFSKKTTFDFTRKKATIQACYMFLNNGKVYASDFYGHNYMPLAISLKIAGENLENSIKINFCTNKKGARYFEVSANYGAFDNNRKYESIDELIDTWQTEYDENINRNQLIMSEELAKKLCDFAERYRLVLGRNIIFSKNINTTIFEEKLQKRRLESKNTIEKNTTD